ncbi:MAG: methyltransferase [Acidobacteria bacterium]|nr:methyltransferase [Acidobacteriota bacterium]MDA1235168.1 methyltransferase [Acidobacteriota bacterium]
MAAEENIQLLQIMGGSVLARAIAAVAEFGVADQIEPGSSRAASELAAATGCHGQALYRCLRYLASHGIFVEDPQGAFGLTPLAAALRTDAPGSFRAGARMFGRMFPAVAELENTLRDGESGFSKAFGEPIFEYLPKQPELAGIFDGGMTAIHGAETPAMLEAFDFSGIGTFADVGGGNGSLLTSVLQKYPAMKGILFDLGHVIERATANLQKAGLSDRCEVREGSFFEAFPEGADAYLMRHIIHDWDDQQSIQILKNCRAVIPPHGRLFIVEAVVPAGNEPSPAKEFDMAMLIYPGGMERTEAEYRSLFAAAGFELVGVTPTASPVSVVEGRPV